MTTETAKNTSEDRNYVTDLYWLALLLTGRQDLSIEVASDTAASADDASSFFTDWMRGWQRRMVIGRALTAIQDEVSDSARRTERARVETRGRQHGWAAPSRNWPLNTGTAKADLQQALLAIDLFPRAVLLLLVFEGLQIADAATLLNADPTLIRKAQAIGLRELAMNLAEKNSPEDRRGNTSATRPPKKLCSWLRMAALCH
jgi:DNA-directed RNA polymerase specialized sigma24 family protein